MRFEFSSGAIRPENDFAESRALEHVFVHFPVAPVIAAFSARSVYNDLAAGLPRCGINLKTPALQSKNSVHRVQRAPERPVHPTLRWIDREDQRTGSHLRRSMLRQGNQHGQGNKQRHAQIENRSQPGLEQSHNSPFPLRRNEPDAVIITL